MLHHLLTRPLVFLDLETTDSNPATARICELAMYKYHPDGLVEDFHACFNPEAPIHPDAQAVHGLCADYLAQYPAFGVRAPEVYNFLVGCDVGGYNVAYFDVPVLSAELGRAGLAVWPHLDVRIADACVVFKKQMPRTLEAAVAHYLGRPHGEGHTARADAQAAAEVFAEQVARHPALGQSMAEWHRYAFGPNERVDVAGKLVRTPSGQVLFNFGKHKGEDVLTQRGYVGWMLRATDEFNFNTRLRLREAVEGHLDL